MPVSKKRKKDGKPVHRSAPQAAPGEEQAPASQGAPGALQQRMGKPSNPFVSQQPGRRGSQRGR
jgi:hypothetical protein